MSNSIDELLKMTKVEFTSGRLYNCEPAWHQTLRVLPDSMWYWLAEGNYICRLEEKTYELYPGDLFIIPAGWKHEVYSVKSQPTVTITVHFHARCYVTNDIADMLSLGGVYQDTDGLFRKATLSINREFEQRRPGYQWNIENWGRQVIVELIRRRGNKFTPNLKLATLQRLGDVLRYIETNLQSSIKIEQLANIATVSEVYLRKMFHACNLGSPSNFIIQRRIFRASELLKSTDYTIKQIASQCGFTDLPFFYRTFKKLISQTPTEFRQNPNI